MNETQAPQEEFYVCAGICRVNPKTNCCAGCGRPWDIPRAGEPSTPQEAGEPTQGQSRKGFEAS